MKKNELTINQLFEKVWKHLWNKPRFIQSGHAKNVKSNFEAHIKAELGEVKAANLSRKKVREWHASIPSSIAANRSLEVLSRMFSYALEMEWTEGNPCIGIKAFTEKKRGLYATENEVKALCEALEKRESVEALFLLTVLFTGARPQSLCRLRWADVNGSVVRFSGKGSADSGEAETLAIPEKILLLWETLPKRVDGFIFGPIRYQSLWNKVRKEIGRSDLWARDLRRTFATIGMSNGISMDVIGGLLNHKSAQTTMIYAKLNQTARLEAVSAIADKINMLLERKI